MQGVETRVPLSVGTVTHILLGLVVAGRVMDVDHVVVMVADVVVMVVVVVAVQYFMLQ